MMQHLFKFNRKYKNRPSAVLTSAVCRTYVPVQRLGLTATAEFNCVSHPFIAPDIHLNLLYILTLSLHPSIHSFLSLFLFLPPCLFRHPPPPTAPLTQDRLGSRDGGTEVEGEAIYPRRIRRCVTEVWTVAAGQ